MPVTQKSSLGSPPTENSCANCGLQRPFENCGNKVNVVAVVVVVDVNSIKCVLTVTSNVPRLSIDVNLHFNSAAN